MIGDLLLEWMSETGSGDVRRLREHLQWVARSEGPSDGRRVTGRWLRDISNLGHAEIDWHSGRWSIAPPSISLLPDSDCRAVLSGARRAGLVAAAREGDLGLDEIPQAASGSDLAAPTALLVTYGSQSSLRAFATTLGATYSGSAPVRLAARIPAIRPGEQAAPPPKGSATLQFLESSEDQSYGVAPPDEASRPDGLYKLEIQGRAAHLYRTEGTWYHVDMAVGMFLELARRGESVVRWRRVRGGRRDLGTVFVDWGAPLPPLHARALVLCSGLVPRFGSAGRTAAYENVPLAVARLIAGSLRQQLTIIP